MNETGSEPMPMRSEAAHSRPVRRWILKTPVSRNMMMTCSGGGGGGEGLGVEGLGSR